MARGRRPVPRASSRPPAEGQAHAPHLPLAHPAHVGELPILRRLKGQCAWWNSTISQRGTPFGEALPKLAAKGLEVAGAVLDAGHGDISTLVNVVDGCRRPHEQRAPHGPRSEDRRLANAGAGRPRLPFDAFLSASPARPGRTHPMVTTSPSGPLKNRNRVQRSEPSGR